MLTKFFNYVAIPKAVALLSLLGLTSMIASCGLLHSNANDYLTAQTTAPIKLPQGTPSITTTPGYPIPAAQQTTTVAATDRFVVPRPAPLQAPKQQIELQSQGEDHWLEVSRQPGALWSAVNSFLVSKDIAIDQADPNTGTINSRWIEASDQSSYTWRLRLEAGLAPNSSEIHAYPIGANITSATASKLTLDLLNQLKLYLENPANSQTEVSILAEQLTNKPRLQLAQTRDKHPILLLELGYDRAWLAVKNSLAKSNIGVADFNRDRGIFYLQPASSKKIPGWLTQASVDQQTIPYQLHLSQGQPPLYLKLSTEDGKPAASQVAKDLFKQIQANLS